MIRAYKYKLRMNRAFLTACERTLNCCRELYNAAAHLVSYAQHFGVDKTIAAWGKNGNYAIGQCEAIQRAFPELWCFGKNPDGSPRHTLMLPYSTGLELFSKNSAERWGKGSSNANSGK